MAAIPFIDTHVHFYDLQHPSLEYGWLKPGVRHHILEAVEPISAQRYWADDWLAETRFANVVKSIHVECAVGTPDPVEETRWLQAFADRLGHPHGIVAEVHLARPDAGEVIEQHLAFANLRGVRDFGEGDYELDPAWRRGFAQLRGHRPGGLPGLAARTLRARQGPRAGLPRHRHLAGPRGPAAAS